MLDQTPCDTCHLPVWKHGDPQSEWGHCGARPYRCPVVEPECCAHAPDRHPDGLCIDCGENHRTTIGKPCGAFLCQRHKDSYTYPGGAASN